MARPGPVALVAGVAAYAAPVLMLAADGALIAYRSVPGLALQRLALTLFVPAIGGVLMLAHDRTRWQMGAGAGLAVVGAAAVAFAPGTLAAPTRPPAILFPLGLLILSSAMIGSSVSRRVAALIAAGALLFPLAHISGVPAALIGGDVILLAAFWQLAPQMMRPVS